MMTSKHQRVQWQTQENICNNNTIHERRQFGWGHNFRLGFKDFDINFVLKDDMGNFLKGIELTKL
jgi:hypothetical protein